MIQLLLKLDTVRAQQCVVGDDRNEPGKKRRLGLIEVFLDRHQMTCETCRRMNTLDVTPEMESGKCSSCHFSDRKLSNQIICLIQELATRIGV